MFCRGNVGGYLLSPDCKVKTPGHGSKPMGSHFGVGEFTTPFRTYFSGWIGSRSLGANDLDFDPVGCSILNRRRYAGVGRVSTYQGNPFWFHFGSVFLSHSLSQVKRPIQAFACWWWARPSAAQTSPRSWAAPRLRHLERFAASKKPQALEMSVGLVENRALGGKLGVKLGLRLSGTLGRWCKVGWSCGSWVVGCGKFGFRFWIVGFGCPSKSGQREKDLVPNTI